jgi:TfoX/Sxy family transcriptional regulator of competence genes
MAYDETLAARVQDLLGDSDDLTSRKMFGGIAYMINGNMACGVIDERVMLRLGNEGAAAALQKKESYLSPMDFTGKTMNSMVYLDDDGHESDAILATWVNEAATFARSLPKKPKKPKKVKK